MFLSDDLFDYHQDKIEKLYKKLFQCQMDIIDAYNTQWEEVNDLIEKGQIEVTEYEADAFGLKTDDMYIFQLDGHLPFIPNYNIKDNYKHYKKSRLFISSRLNDVCNKIGTELIPPPVGIIIAVHHYGKIFDVNNFECQLIVNTFKRRLYKDDNIRIVPFMIQMAIPTSDKLRTMIYVGSKEYIATNVLDIAEEYHRIDTLPGAVAGNIPRLARKELIKKSTSTLSPCSLKTSKKLPERDIM